MVTDSIKAPRIVGNCKKGHLAEVAGRAGHAWRRPGKVAGFQDWSMILSSGRGNCSSFAHDADDREGNGKRALTEVGYPVTSLDYGLHGCLSENGRSLRVTSFLPLTRYISVVAIAKLLDKWRLGMK
jgi:hypothetical protein